MPSYRLVLEYDGGDFAGWQLQAEGARTVQGCLEHALTRVTGETARVAGSGRTDAGVHAEGQVACFVLRSEREPARLVRALNGVLPPDVAVRRLEAVCDGFDPQREAVRKAYRYQVWNAAARSPLRSRRFCHVAQPLDLAAMRSAAAALVGEHDFASFRAAGSRGESNVRRLERLDLEGAPGGEIHFHVVGSGFLRHMVRNLVGTLLEVGRGRRDPGSMPALLAARDRSRAGPTALAHGLTLAWVEYADGFSSQPPAGCGGGGHSAAKAVASARSEA